MALTPTNRTASHHPAWSSLAKLANEDIERLLEHFFSSTDNLLYDLSKRASSNSEAAFYFDAMRELRIMRHHAIKAFCERLTQHAQLLSAGIIEPAQECGDLSLLSSDELDRELACENVINNVCNLYHDDLRLLTRRLIQLTPANNLHSDQMPFAPSWLARNFAQVLPIMNGKITVILFKQLEKHLLRQLGPLLAQCNEYLVNEGLFADTPNYNQRMPLPKLSDIQTSLDDLIPRLVSPSQFALPLHSLRQILANARFQAANDAVLGYRYAFNPGPVVPLSIFGTALTQQQRQEAELPQFPLKNKVADYVSRALHSENTPEPNALNPYHEDIIQLVEAFFNELLEDNQLTVISQSLLCRLQIPVLKVALRNENIFSDSKHPAREFLNKLTMAAQTIEHQDKPDDDPLYGKLLDTVKRINSLYDLNDDIFSSELDTINSIQQQETKRADIIEQRTRQAEEGKQRFERAKNAAIECINHFIGGLTLHPATHRFVHEHWQQVLVLTFLKEGQGPQWLTHGQTLNDLLWLDQEHTDERSQVRAQQLLTTINDRLCAGLSLLHLTQEQCQQLATHAVKTTQAQDPNSNVRVAKPPITTTAIDRQRENFAALQQAFFNTAKNLAAGTWLHYQHNAASIMCKLASNNSDDLLFVNRLGIKTFTKTRQELAMDLQNDKAKIMLQEPLFDRLMNRALSHFKPKETTPSKPTVTL